MTTTPSIPVTAQASDASLTIALRTPLNPWRRLARNMRYPPTLLGLILCLIFLITAAIAPLVAPFPYQKIGTGTPFEAPSESICLARMSLGAMCLAACSMAARLACASD